MSQLYLTGSYTDQESFLLMIDKVKENSSLVSEDTFSSRNIDVVSFIITSEFKELPDNEVDYQNLISDTIKRIMSFNDDSKLKVEVSLME